MASEYRCVGCGFRVKSLFIQYSPGNIRLMKCGNCKEVADEYIECERMIIFIDLILHRPKVLISVLSANAAFILSFAIAAKCLLNEVSRRRDIMLGILISSYFKIFLLAMLVWEFPMSVIFIVDILILTSNTMALEVMTESSTTRCIAVCLIAHLVRFLVGQILEPTTFLTQLGSLMHLSSLFRIA